MLRRIGPTRTELAGLAVCALTFTCWNVVSRQTLALGVPWFFLVLCLAVVLTGRAAVRIVRVDASHDFPTAFLVGFLLLNSALLALAWTSPFSIATNALFLLACALALQVVGPAPTPAPDPGRGTRLASPGLVAVVLSLTAATLWSQDSIAAQIVLPEGVVLRPWLDSLFHARQVQVFRDAPGPVTVDDPRMAGQPMWFYHHGSYMTTALVSRVTGTPAILAFTSFQVPFGEVIAGLAAYALIRSLWGDRAGVAAAAALLLSPDASWHGLANPCLGYHWLQQIAPAGLYGVALLAVAWLLMFEGCRTGRLALIALAFLAAGLSLQYKAHLFVAVSLLIWIYPGLFLRGFRWRWKLAWLAFSLASFVLVVGLSRRFESIPVLRFDGSSLKAYASLNVGWLARGPTRRFFAARITETSSLAQDAFWGAILLFYGTFGLFGVAVVFFLLVVLARGALRRPIAGVRLEHVVFPLLIIVNYLVMSLGLAYNNRPPAHPEELLHRPLVWAYFVVAAWAGGLAYTLFLENQVRRSNSFRNSLLVVLGLLLVVPYRLGQNVQVGPDWGRRFTNQAYPRGWFECARYIREHARPGDVIQDAEGDTKLMVGAISEHPGYAIDYFDTHRPPVLIKRLQELRGFKGMTDAEAIRRFAARRRIRWYVSHPETRLRWPASILNHPAFSWNDFCVYLLSP